MLQNILCFFCLLYLLSFIPTSSSLFILVWFVTSQTRIFETLYALRELRICLCPLRFVRVFMSSTATFTRLAVVKIIATYTMASLSTALLKPWDLGVSSHSVLFWFQAWCPLLSVVTFLLCTQMFPKGDLRYLFRCLTPFLLASL